MATKQRGAKSPTGTKRHAGDVLGISRATVRVHGVTKPGGRRPKGIEVARPRNTKPARVVGGVRGRGR